MPLQFPNARLFIHDLLSNQRYSPSQAIAISACQYGLIPPEQIDDVEVSEDSSCQCLATARNVLLKYFKEKEQQQGVPVVDIDEVWATMEKYIESHRQARRLQEPATDKQPHDCAKLAPALFDYLLQQISRYP